MQSLSLQCAVSDLAALAQSYTIDDRELDAIKAGRDGQAQGWLEADQFIAIAKWKSARPTRLYWKNTENSVRCVTKSAFAATGDMDRVVLLTELHGVNVRTATAILHLAHADGYPLLDVWAMTAMGYTRGETEKWDELDWLRVWPTYVAACRKLSCDTSMDMRTLDRALWKYGERAGSRRRKTKL